MPHITREQLLLLRDALGTEATPSARAAAQEVVEALSGGAELPDVPLLQVFAAHPMELDATAARAALGAAQRLLLHSSLGILGMRMPPWCGVIQLANATVARLFGTSVEELRRLTVVELLEISEAELEAAVRLAGEQGRSRYLELARRGATGEMQWAGCNIHAMHRGGELVGAMIVVRDITAQVRTEQRLRESLKLLDAVEESGPLPMCITDEGGRYVLVNRAYCALLGYSREELIGEHYSIIIPPEQQVLAHRAYYGSFEGINSDGEWPLMRRGGQVFAASIESTAFVTAEGRNLLVSSVQDLTERKRHELMWAKLDARISQSQKLESLGLLAGGIAHDFSNVLAGIITNLDQLCDGAPGEARGEIMRDLRDAAQGASSLIQTLTSYAGQRPAARRTADLGALVEETVRLLRTSLKREQRCILALDEGPLLAQVDASQLQQVLINLIINAQEATAEGGRPVEIRLTRRILGATEQVDLVTASLIQPGLYAIISVQDWGVGIDMASQQRIFDPFFTTKMTGRGLGLSSAAGIVRAHGGSIQLTSAPGEGSTFDVLLPLEVEPAASE